MNISEIDFGAELAAMNEKFLANSENITLPERPPWLEDDDELSLLYSEFPKLIRRGGVYWASIIQANTILFKRPDDFLHTKTDGSYVNRVRQINSAAFTKPLFAKPTGASVATLIYNHKRPKTADSDPLILRTFAHYLFECKSKPTEEIPPWLLKAVEVVKAEFDRSQVIIKAGEKDDFLMNVTMQSIIVFREHLPKGVLKNLIVPIIAAPQKTKSAVILPYKYWTKKFTAYWNKSRAE